jgi:chromosome segregation ATPase
MDQQTTAAFAALTETVERGFSAVAEDIAEIRKDTADIRRQMATKDDLAAVRLELKSDIASLGVQVASIERDLKQIRRDLSALTDKVDNIAGYRKEIDHALERIAAIEKHLGITKKIPA